MFRSPSPAKLPPFSLIVDDIHATPVQIAKHLDIAPSTLAKYIKTGNVPRPVMLALFWETRWGRSIADCDASNYAAIMYRQNQSLKEHAKRTSGIIWRLEMELARSVQPGTPANLPVWNVA